MCENVYDVKYTEELNSREQAEMAVNIFANAEAIRSYNANTDMENGNTTRNLQVRHTGTQVLRFACLNEGSKHCKQTETQKYFRGHIEKGHNNLFFFLK
ncbi:hypothetical protein PHYPO_G00250670 [Pangasianodon hypophthalmus]|uniref:Uncharacterized protein n=1 Tax=Pangasianodon hypophthalmus TaxID=310915 RepID=A0A5N5JCH5_PANHP|nr:hypothetical protein PHYPO_G00250670 [Pangasianodon hypophthalmus]